MNVLHTKYNYHLKKEWSIEENKHPTLSHYKDNSIT
jgi:hypothetical protein